MEKVTGKSFSDLQYGSRADRKQFFSSYCTFFKDMTYDTVSFEVCATDVLPDHGAIMGGKPGPIQTRADFDAYPWDELPKRYWDCASSQFGMLAECMPEGMKAVGGVGNGVFEVAEDLVGFEYLSYMQLDDPQLFNDLFKKIGEYLLDLWVSFLSRYDSHYAVCRMGDDLGFKSGTLLQPGVIVSHVIPQYRKIIDLVHRHNLPFLLHSCGRIFDVMDTAIAAGIDAKHSNEDTIAPFSEWISRYGNNIGLFGGIDVDLLCTKSPRQIYETVLEHGHKFRNMAQGYAIGSGNSIPDYVPVDGYMAMIDAVQELRRREPN
jgi:uroporphyrinogen decarboxylase